MLRSNELKPSWIPHENGPRYKNTLMNAILFLHLFNVRPWMFGLLYSRTALLRIVIQLWVLRKPRYFSLGSVAIGGQLRYRPLKYGARCISPFWTVSLCIGLMNLEIIFRRTSVGWKHAPKR